MIFSQQTLDRTHVNDCCTETYLGMPIDMLVVRKIYDLQRARNYSRAALTSEDDLHLLAHRIRGHAYLECMLKLHYLTASQIECLITALHKALADFMEPQNRDVATLRSITAESNILWVLLLHTTNCILQNTRTDVLRNILLYFLEIARNFLLQNDLWYHKIFCLKPFCRSILGVGTKGFTRKHLLTGPFDCGLLQKGLIENILCASIL